MCHRGVNQQAEHRLTQAMAALYDAFAGYGLASVAGCPHCVDDEDQRTIRRVPLRQLTGHDLNRYAFKALTTWGDAHDLRHFLPRLLELAARGELTVDAATVLGKLRLAQWSTWPPDERDAVTGFLAAWWRWDLATFPGPHDIATLLRAIAQAVDDLSPFLSTWLDPPTEPALRHLAGFIDETASTVRHRPSGPVYRDACWRHDQSAQLLTWLTRLALREVVENAFFDAGSAPVAAELSIAADQLAWLAAADADTSPLAR